jgi:hypothetical protein
MLKFAARFTCIVLARLNPARGAQQDVHVNRSDAVCVLCLALRKNFFIQSKTSAAFYVGLA